MFFSAFTVVFADAVPVLEEFFAFLLFLEEADFLASVFAEDFPDFADFEFPVDMDFVEPPADFPDFFSAEGVVVGVGAGVLAAFGVGVVFDAGFCVAFGVGVGVEIKCVDPPGVLPEPGVGVGLPA